jgi:hypothetical protein
MNPNLKLVKNIQSTAKKVLQEEAFAILKVAENITYLSVGGGS